MSRHKRFSALPESSLARAIHERAIALDEPRNLAPLIDQLSKAKIVMLGEASHGTHEFYDWRRIISEWLITKHDFNFIAVEGDWPPCQELNRYIRGEDFTNSAPRSSREALSHFKRWPTWMWANTEVMRLADWMHTHNQTFPPEKRAGFHGLDVYSLFESLDAVLARLQSLNPFLAKSVRDRYACFDPFERDEKRYARSLIQFPKGCEDDALSVLQDLLKLRLDGMREREAALFDAQQNARIIANAENYYRAMMHGNEDSWNIRDRHMIETLEILLDRSGPDSKAIVWAHNTHIGDYRATPMESEGQVNIGGLARQIWGDTQVALVGFGTFQGEVIASPAWDGPVEVMRVPEGKPGTMEAAFHEAALALRKSSIFLTHLDRARSGALSEVHGHRAIGVVYQPAHERFGNYVPTSLSHRYDAFVFIDRTAALEPLIQGFDRVELPETWPAGV